MVAMIVVLPLAADSVIRHARRHQSGGVAVVDMSAAAPRVLGVDPLQHVLLPVHHPSRPYLEALRPVPRWCQNRRVAAGTRISAATSLSVSTLSITHGSSPARANRGLYFGKHPKGLGLGTSRPTIFWAPLSDVWVVDRA